MYNLNIYINLTRNARLPYPQSPNSQGQETFLAPSYYYENHVPSQLLPQQHCDNSCNWLHDVCD